MKGKVVEEEEVRELLRSKQRARERSGDIKRRMQLG